MRQAGSSPAVVEGLESRTLLSSIAQVGGVGYLPSDDGTQFQRYDIANQKWLSPVTLASSRGGATASLVDGDGIYVAYDRSVVRYKLDGSKPTHLINATDTVHEIHSDGKLLFLNHSTGLYARFVSIDKTTNTIIDTMEHYVDSVWGSSISTSANKIFGRSVGVSPSDITFVAYDNDGMFGAAGDSPYHGDFEDASETWVFPQGTKVVDDSGGVYATSNLKRLGSFATEVDDIAFVGGDVPIVLKGNKLTAYSSTILPTGSKALARAATQILVNGKNVIAFNPSAASANRYTTQVVPLSDLKAPQPGAAVNPVGLKYVPDDVEVAANGTLLVLDKETRSIFRWDPATQSYGATIPLVDVPEYMAYSAVTNTVYVAYDSGLIGSIAVGARHPAETPFVVLPGGPGGLATAGKYVFAQDYSGAWATHYTFAPDGTAISAVDWNYSAAEFVWNAANSKMYFIHDNMSPLDLHAEEIGADGVIGEEIESWEPVFDGYSDPVRVSPDGKTVILGSGVVHDGVTLDRRAGGLGNAVSDVAWLKGTVYTVRGRKGNAHFQQWTGATFAPGAVVDVAGSPVALVSVADSTLVGISRPTSGVPQFRVMGVGLQTIAPPSTPNPPTTPNPPPTTPNPPPPAAPADVVIQSEAAALSGGTVTSAKSAGYSGTGYARYGGKGSAVTYTVTRASAGAAKLTFRYSNGSVENRRVRVFVNGSLIATLLFQPTGAWTTWRTISLDAVKLPKGAVEIKCVASRSVGGPRVDQLAVFRAGTTLETEAQPLSGGAAKDSGSAGYSGTGYAKFGGKGSGVTFSVLRGSAGAGKLTFGYANGGTADRPLQVFVNGSLAGTLLFPPTGAWTVWKSVSLDVNDLPAGAVTIRVVASTSAGGPNLDWATIV